MKIDSPLYRNKLPKYFAAGMILAGSAACTVLLALAPRPVRASSKQAQAVGAAVFHDKGCQHCHGVDAIGTDRGPDLLSVGKKWHKDRIEQQIREGGGGMPAFGDVLQPDEIKSLVDFLSAKRKSAHNSGSSSAVDKPAGKEPSNDNSSE